MWLWGLWSHSKGTRAILSRVCAAIGDGKGLRVESGV